MDGGSNGKRSETAGGATSAGAEQEDVICDGKYVVVERGDQQRIILFKTKQTISFGKGSTQQDILLEGALGCDFLSAFKASPAPPEVANHKQGTGAGGRSKHGKKQGSSSQNLYVLEKSEEPVAKAMKEFYQLPDSVSSGTDNRNILDDNSSQALSKEDIVSLREQGISSKDIMDTLITSSKSFSQKTEFAQEKWMKKKEKVYGDVLMFYKPSISILADFYYQKDPIKVLGLRPDTVSQILSFSNVHANGKYLVFDNGNGLIVASVLQRLKGHGQVLHCHIGSNPSRTALVCMNFTERDLKSMMNLDLLYLLREIHSGEKGKPEPGTEEAPLEEEPRMKKRKLDDNGEAPSAHSTEADGNGISAATQILKHNNTREDNERSLEFLHETEFDGLIICAKEHPLSIFQQLVKRLALSTPFVIYCQYPEPLMDCYMWVKEKGVGINVHLVDNWFRNIQVDRDRTHPEIQMSPSGGYLLFGTYIESSQL